MKTKIKQVLNNYDHPLPCGYKAIGTITNVELKIKLHRKKCEICGQIPKVKFDESLSELKDMAEVYKRATKNKPTSNIGGAVYLESEVFDSLMEAE